MKRTIIAAAILFSASSLAEYNMRVPLVDKVTFYPNSETTYGDWTKISGSDSCSEFSPETTTVPFGIGFLQSKDCSFKEERTVTVVASNDNGDSIVISDGKEEKTITDTESENTIGEQSVISVSGASSVEFQNDSSTTLTANIGSASPSSIEWSHSGNVSVSENNDKITLVGNGVGSASVKFRMHHDSGITSPWSLPKTVNVENKLIDTRYLTGQNFSGSTYSIGGYAANNFTMEAWVKPRKALSAGSVTTNLGVDGVEGENYVFSAVHGGDSGSHGLGLSVGTNGIKLHAHSSGYMPSLLVTYRSIPSTSWTHVAVSVVNNTPRLYINGNLAGTGLKPSSGFLFSSDTLGHGYGPLHAEVAQARMWNNSLSESQIRSNYLNYLEPGTTVGSTTLNSVNF